MPDPAMLGQAAGFVGLVASLVYILSIVGYRFTNPFSGHLLIEIPEEERSRPNRATWLIWSLLGGIQVYSYYKSGATNTLWAAVVLTVEFAVIALLSFKFGTKCWYATDTLCFIGAASCAYFWYSSKSAEITLFLTLLIDFFGAIPTLRKAWVEPKSENGTAWTITVISSTLNLGAVEWHAFTFTLSSIAIASYPTYMFIGNGLILLTLVAGRWCLKNPP